MIKPKTRQNREYASPESAARQKHGWEVKGYKVTRRGNVLHLSK
ncbi:MAG: hypothetical protein WDA75_10490 [Candidatus Latescibacterota bacterium]|jgi:hypothetical protein